MLDRVPDESLITTAMGASDHIQATRGKDYLFVYSAQGKPITVNMGKISGNEVAAYWYNPKNGESKSSGRIQNRGRQTFTPPSSGYGEDWVLVLDDASKKFKDPKFK
jgi:hypothetical protein